MTTLLSYEGFKNIVKNNILEYLPEEFMDSEISINCVQKVNESLDALNVCRDTQANLRMSPNVYLEEMYNMYIKSGNIEETLEEIARVINIGYAHMPDVNPLASLSVCESRQKIVMCLIPRKGNEELLKDVPHENFLDLAIVYRLLITESSDGTISAIVRYNMLEPLGIAEGELKGLAQKNTPRLLPAKVRPMGEVIAEMASNSIADFDPEFSEVTSPLWVVSNSTGVNGAAVLAYNNVLEQVAEKLGEDLYVLPSSIHECLTLPVSFGELDDLQAMVKDINATQVAPNEVLSNSVYFYSRATGKLSMAS